jgi:hypothetical protein
MERQEPKDVKSRMEQVEPSRAMPKTDVALPKRTKVRRLIDDPSVAKSKTLRLLPRRDIP